MTWEERLKKALPEAEQETITDLMSEKCPADFWGSYEAPTADEFCRPEECLKCWRQERPSHCDTCGHASPDDCPECKYLNEQRRTN